jgi:osmotically-inducible protein OsmY
MTWQAVSDAELHRMVLDRLRWAPDVDDRQIGVAVREAVVTLTGVGASPVEKQAAVRTATGVPGVRAVVDEITVPKFVGARPDGDLAAAVQLVLARHPGLDHPAIGVHVHHQVVRLTGAVNSIEQRAAARRAAQAVVGVRAVIDELELPPPPTAGLTRERVLQSVGPGSVKAVDIHVDGRVATLEGRVHSWYDRRAVERATRSVPGMARVDNRLVVAR